MTRPSTLVAVVRVVALTVLIAVALGTTALGFLWEPSDGPAALAPLNVLLPVAVFATLIPAILVLVRGAWHPIGWLLAWMSVTNAVLFYEHLFATTTSPWLLWATDLWLSHSFFATLIKIVVIFPNGLSGRALGQRRVARTMLVASWLVVAAAMLVDRVGGQGARRESADNPLGVGFLTRELVEGLTFVLVALLVVGVVLLWRRGSRATGMQWNQFRVVKLAFGTLAASLLVGLALSAVLPAGADLGYVWIPIVVSFVVVGAAFSVAILRHRLFDIDRVVSRTVSYGLLTTVLIGTYVAVVFLMRELLPTEGDLPVAVSTLAVAALFNPARRHIQAVVDRRFNRSRYDAAQALELFARQLRSTVDFPGLRSDLVTLVSSTLEPASVSLWTSNEKTGG
jgi:hypothetical protein